jgi:hypothetical protein
MQIAVVNHSDLEDADVAFMVEACNQQVIECAKAYDVDPTPAVFYSDASGLPQSNCRIMDIVDDLDQPNALGFHDDALGIVYGRVLAQGPDDTSVTLSHECLEELIDPTCGEWRPMGGGRLVALEICDPVEGDSYTQTVTVLGMERRVRLSNFVLPRWFDAVALGALDAMRVLSEPFQMDAGGYMIVRDATGNESNVFARIRFGGHQARAAVGTKVANPTSRLARRLRNAA